MLTLYLSFSLSLFHALISLSYCSRGFSRRRAGWVWAEAKHRNALYEKLIKHLLARIKLKVFRLKIPIIYRILSKHETALRSSIRQVMDNSDLNKRTINFKILIYYNYHFEMKFAILQYLCA